ncbi:glycosyltransferase family 2 protein [Massilia agilis]|uniref:Glycosyltransferase family 2 protein n=1 Tax=Massilia agilis TaxID=1811226 RepID=A0ABT2DD59_9BURK|nr:glycosyltransferase family A protein [Massilia agilis]MCS0809144.1 glycosyltransferase family 2 protein [Massilia agilis]
MPTVSVIIPTTCEERRWSSLQRAIASTRASEGVDVKVIVVVNGKRFDAAKLAELRERPDITVAYREEGSAPLAQRHGRTLVDTEFFAFLDDDDEYQPQALALRCAPLLADPRLGFVATNGYRCVGGEDRLMVSCAAAVRADPLAALARENWLASCGGLFRTSSIGPVYFDDPAPFLEWTYLAYRLALDFNMAFVDTPTFRIHDTPASLSKSDAYRAAELDVLRRIAALPLPAPVARQVRGKVGAACHDLADQARMAGRYGRALALHARSLLLPGGWRYLAWSRKLLPFAFKRPAAAS